MVVEPRCARALKSEGIQSEIFNLGFGRSGEI